MEKNIGPIDCKSAGELMFDYLDGELNKTEAWSLEAHLSGCEDCKKELEERKKILDTVKLTAANPPAELKSGVMKKIENIPEEKAGWSFKPSARFTSILAVAACAVIMVAVCFRGGLFSGVTTGDMPAGHSDGALYEAEEPSVKTLAARAVDTYAGTVKGQDYSEAPANAIKVKVQGAVTENIELAASETDCTVIERIYDAAIEALGENTAVVVGYAEPFSEIISDAHKSEIELDGVKYDCYSVTENCDTLVKMMISGEFATGGHWLANMPSGAEITEIHFIILDK